MSSKAATTDAQAGTANLWVVTMAAVPSFLISAVLEYCLPLYFNAIKGLSRDAWSQLVLWQVMPWIFTPALAGLLSRRFGERRIWGVALVGQSAVPIVLWKVQEAWIVRPLALWNGFTTALMWVGGVSLVQIVPPAKRGLANGLMMTALGVGSFLGPLLGRGLLWRQFVAEMLVAGDVAGVGEFLVNLRSPPADPPLANFGALLMGLCALALATSAMIWRFGQRPGRAPGEGEAHTVGRALADLRRLLSEARFWALTISLGFCGGPVFQATNQFLKYRAEDLALIVGSQDRGWILLQLLRAAMWIPGGLAVSLLAGRRAPGIVAVILLATFSLTGLGIGLATASAGLFVAVAAFEFVRQFMRWSHAGYLSEHMPAELRATAIGCSISIACVGSTLFGALPLVAMDAGAADFDSSVPFYIAAALGLLGAFGLFVFDRVRPIRQTVSIADGRVVIVPREEAANA